MSTATDVEVFEAERPRLHGLAYRMLGVHADAPRFRDAVSSAMNAAPETLAPGASLAQLQAVLDRGLVAIVADASGFHGLITRFDLLNHLRRKLA